MQGPIAGPFVLEYACAELTALLAALEAVVEMPHCDWLASYLTGLQSSTAVAAQGAAAQMSPPERPTLERAAAAGIRWPHGTPPVDARSLWAAG